MLLNFQIISFIAIIILVVSSIYSVLIHEIYIVSLILNILVGLLLLVFIFFPSHIEIFSIISGIYSSTYFVINPDNTMSVLMFFICVSTLYARGFFNRKIKQKFVLAVVIFLGFWLSGLRNGLDTFFSSGIQVLGYAFSCFCILFFILIKPNRKTDEEINKILDLSKYDGLKKRDAEWLNEVIKKTKYETIAIQSEMTEGAVKNRFRQIYKILNVGDKIGFLNKYYGYTVCFSENS